MVRLQLAANCFWALVVLLALVLPGCGGCFDSQPPQQPAQKPADQKKKDEKPKPNFEVGKLQILPGEEKGQLSGVKPGHWTSAALALKPNNNDVEGTLESFAADKDSNRPLPLEGVPHRLTFTRPVALAKGQTKYVELMYYVPRREMREQGYQDLIDTIDANDQARSVWLQGRLIGRSGALEMSPVVQPVSTMPAHQFFLIVLSAKPEKYIYLRTLDSVKLGLDALDDSGRNTPYYQVVLPPIDKRVPVPAHPLAWTAVSVLVWDDIDPSLLTPEQRDAMIDWLHFGGQLIVSGPSSLGTLKGSFLGPYLPATGGATLPIAEDKIAELDRIWTKPEGPARKLRPIPYLKDKPPLGIELVKQEGGEPVPETADLIYERRVGRGRIAVTSFALTGSEWVKWPAYDSFWNACLLRRPPRRYERTQEVLRVDWADSARYGRLDPRLISGLRYLSRDLGSFRGRTEERFARNEPPPQPMIAQYELEDGSVLGQEPQDEATRRRVRVVYTQNRGVQPVNGLPPLEPVADPVAQPTPWKLDSQPVAERGYVGSSDAGVAGWNDSSGIANASRSALTDAAGIKVPSLTLVVQVLAIYLVALVPINWGFFWLVGRVEWAWFAAPLIAIAGAVVVVQQAQLDIGFARSRTELCVLELQSDHPRGHLTRFTAVYTSLSTNYDLVYDSPSAIGLPFSRRLHPDKLALKTPTDVTFLREDHPSLRGFQVFSNTTEMLHSEQVFDVGGGVTLRSVGGDPAIKNDTNIALEDVGVIRRVSKDQVEVAWIGSLPARTSKPVKFVAPTKDGELFAQREQTAVTRSSSQAGTLNLHPLLQLVEDPRGLEVGDARLVAYSSTPLAGMTVEPAAAQEGSLTLVVVHLKFGDWETPQPDVNTKADVDLDAALPGPAP